MGRPPGFLADFSMTGGTALISTVFATRPCFCVAGYVTGGFASACRMTYVNRVTQIQLLNELIYIGRVRIHFVASVRLRGTLMSAAIMCDDSVSPFKKEHELCVPVVG